jgi:hypothetical protein
MGALMCITALNDPVLAGRNPADEHILQELTLYPKTDSCLPSPPYGIHWREGTALLELESIIREQLKTAGLGVRAFHDMKSKRCRPAQR